MNESRGGIKAGVVACGPPFVYNQEVLNQSAECWLVSLLQSLQSQH